jgi:flagellar hook-length control protein FliK
VTPLETQAAVRDPVALSLPSSVDAANDVPRTAIVEAPAPHAIGVDAQATPKSRADLKKTARAIDSAPAEGAQPSRSTAADEAQGEAGADLAAVKRPAPHKATPHALAQLLGDGPAASTEVHPGVSTPAGQPLDGAQLLALQQPAQRVVNGIVPAVQPATPDETTAAAVPLAGVAVEITAHAQAGRNRFEIRLDPPELGRIDVRLDIDHSGAVTSRLTVDRIETLDALRRDSGDLERALQQAGLKTTDNGMQFTLRDQSFAGRDDSAQKNAAARVVVPDPDLAPVDTVRGGYGRLLRPGGGIDIRV